MAHEYHKVGTTWRGYLIYIDPATGSPATGKVNGDWTVEVAKNGTGNQSTAGITITEVDATNNAGLYEVEVSGSTGFVSATGQYEVTAYIAGDGVEDGHTMSLGVTNDGTGAGSWGDASFTATSGDGRVTDGGAGLQGATVRIVDSNGALFVQTTTDANGDWGPIYFNTDGTYTIYAQKSGYDTGSDTISVSGATATGPGANIAMTAASSASTLLASTLTAYAIRQYVDRQGAKADTEKYDIVNDALAYLATAKDWPFLLRHGVIDFVAPYTTGTIAITTATTTVTLSGGTWPSWAASGHLVIDSQLYEVASRDSDTQLTLSETFNGDTISAGSYTLMQYRYTLPTDLLKIKEILLGDDWPWGTTSVAQARLDMAVSQHQWGRTGPSLWAVSHNLFSVWPWPTTKRRVNLLYQILPTELSDPSDTADWDASQRMTLYRAIDYQVSLRGECVAGTPGQTLGQLNDTLAQTMPVDRDRDAPRLNGGIPSMRSDRLLEDISTS